MTFIDVGVVLVILAMVAAVAFELRIDRDKKMYVGGEAKTLDPERYPPSTVENVTPEDKEKSERKSA